MPLDKCKKGSGYWLLIIPIIAVAYFQKLGIPLGGNLQLAMPAAVIFGAVVIGVLSGHLIFHTKRLCAFCLTMGILFLTQMLGALNVSISSLALLVFIHLPYVFSLKDNDILPLAEITFYQKTMVVLSVMGTLAYFLQFIIGPELAFLIDFKFPDWLILQGFNNLNVVGYGAPIYKSNGFFLQEPSVFSQMLAIALMFELLYTKNLKRAALYILALSVTFSGTGLIILFVLLPIYMLQQKRFISLFVFLIMILSAPLWAPYVGLEKTVNRATEFSSEHSSGFARFISPAITIKNILLPEGERATLFGMGAGSMFRTLLNNGFDYATSTSTWGKAVFEYGIIGGLVYFLFMSYLIFSGPRSIYIAMALFIQFWLLGEYILSPISHGLILGLLVWARADVTKPKQEDLLRTSENREVIST